MKNLLEKLQANFSALDIHSNDDVIHIFKDDGSMEIQVRWHDSLGIWICQFQSLTSEGAVLGHPVEFQCQSDKNVMLAIKDTMLDMPCGAGMACSIIDLLPLYISRLVEVHNGRKDEGRAAMISALQLLADAVANFESVWGDDNPVELCSSCPDKCEE